jgi:hypothetical protein
MVVALGIVVFLEIDPLFVVSIFFPSPILRLEHCLAEDLSFGFLMVFSISMLEGAVRHEEERVFMGWPIVQALCGIAAGVMSIEDRVITFQFGPRMLPSESRPKEGKWKLKAAVLFGCILIVRAVFLGLQAKDDQKVRLAVYLAAVAFNWTGEILLRAKSLEGTVAAQIAPLALHAAFLFMIEQLHRELEALPYRPLHEAGRNSKEL